MGIFGSPKNVNKTEFNKKVRAKLRAAGIKGSRLEEVAKVFHGDLHESGSQQGIDAKEIDRGIAYMRKKSRLSSDQVDIVEETLKAHL